MVIGTHGLKNLTLSLYRVPPANTSAAALHAVAGLPLLTVDGLIQHVAPAWVSLMPPVLTIIIAVWLRQVLIALFAGMLRVVRAPRVMPLLMVDHPVGAWRK